MNPLDWLQAQKWAVDAWLFTHQAQLAAVWDFIDARRNVLMMLCALGFVWYLRRAKRKGWL